MKQPGLDDRNRDNDGEIRQRRGDTLNKNLPTPVPGFGPNITLARMRKATSQVSEADVRRAAAKLHKNRIHRAATHPPPAAA